MKFGTASAVTLMLLSAAGAANAADAPMMVDEAAIAMATPDWDGFYVGIGVGYVSSTTIVETVGLVTAHAGFNATFGDNFLLGAEGTLSWNSSSLGGAAYYALDGEGRVGVLATDNLLLYAALGGEFVQGGNTYLTLGGGIELLVMDSLSIDLEYKYYHGLNNAWRGNGIGLSANWHF